MKKRMRWLLGEKKKAVIVPIVMAAVLFMSSTTVFAYSSYREAEVPLEDGEYVLGMESIDEGGSILSIDENGEDTIGGIDSVHFYGGSGVFQEEGSNEYVILEERGGSDYLLCLHEWTHGYYYYHKSLSGGRCRVRKYEGDMCRKCQSERNMVLISLGRAFTAHITFVLSHPTASTG